MRPDPFKVSDNKVRSKVGFTSCPILYEDEWLIFVNKPSGVLSHPNPSGRGKTAFEGRYNLSDRRFDSPAGPCWLVHRLDQDTSGVLLAAKTKEGAIACRGQFEENKVTKLYKALIKGIPHVPKGIWKDYLEKDAGKGRVRSRVVKGRPPNAELRYEIQNRWNFWISGENGSINRSPAGFARVSFIDFNLISGKTHQIRVQAASRGTPIIGDDIYGDFPFNRVFAKQHGFRGLFLHASILSIAHPRTKKSLEVKSPLPEEFENAIKALSVQKSS